MVEMKESKRKKSKDVAAGRSKDVSNSAAKSKRKSRKLISSRIRVVETYDSPEPELEPLATTKKKQEGIGWSDLDNFTYLPALVATTIVNGVVDGVSTMTGAGTETTENAPASGDNTLEDVPPELEIKSREVPQVDTAETREEDKARQDANDAREEVTAEVTTEEVSVKDKSTEEGRKKSLVTKALTGFAASMGKGRILVDSKLSSATPTSPSSDTYHDAEETNEVTSAIETTEMSENDAEDEYVEEGIEVDELLMAHSVMERATGSKKGKNSKRLKFAKFIGLRSVTPAEEPDDDTKSSSSMSSESFSESDKQKEGDSRPSSIVVVASGVIEVEDIPTSDLRAAPVPLSRANERCLVYSPQRGVK